MVSLLTHICLTWPQWVKLKSHLAISYLSVANLFRNCTQSTIVSLPCCVQNLKTIQQLKWMWWHGWMRFHSRDLWQVGEWYTISHWGRVMHICVGKLTIIGSDNGLSPGRRQAIIWTNAGILLIEPLGTNFSEILIRIQIFSFKKLRLKMSSAKWRPFCLGLNVILSLISPVLPWTHQHQHYTL